MIVPTKGEPKQSTQGEMMKVLPSLHNSPATAYIIEDYPFGSGLRCFKRIWIESRGKGAKAKCQRVVYQTTKRLFNKSYTGHTAPMISPHLWNAEKKGIYGAMQILFVEEETGHIKVDGLGEYPWEEHCETFAKTYGPYLDEEQSKRLQHLHSGLILARLRQEGNSGETREVL